MEKTTFEETLRGAKYDPYHTWPFNWLVKFVYLQYFPLAHFARYYRVTDEALIAETAVRFISFLSYTVSHFSYAPLFQAPHF